MSSSCPQVLPYVREWEGGHPKFPGVVGMPFRISGSGREALPDDREWSVFPSRMSGSGRETLTDVPERSVDLPDVRQWWESLTDIQEWLGGPPGCP